MIYLLMNLRNLPNKDSGGVSDPICAVFCSTPSKGTKELGRTELIMNSLNPTFKKSIDLKFSASEDQTLTFKIYDVDFVRGKEVD